MGNFSIKVGGVSGALSVCLGALGAHALKNHLSADNMLIFETGVRYQIIHTIMIVVLAFYSKFANSDVYRLSIQLFTIGIILFSGSLYFLALRPLFDLNSIHWPGILTPIGGVAFVLGWLSVAFK